MDSNTDNDNYQHKVAFVLGNGRSRHRYDITILNKYGTVYGCNAIYNDIIPDHLIVVDKAMVDILLRDNIQDKTNVYIDHRLPYTDKKLHKFDCKVDDICDSGNMACMLAAFHKHTQVIMLGFDYISKDGYHNNVYAGQKPYKDKHNEHTLPVSVQNWYNKAMLTFSRYPQTLFMRVNGNDYDPPLSGKNYVNLDIEDLNKLFSDVYDDTIIIPNSYIPNKTIAPIRQGRVSVNDAPLLRGMIKWAR